MSQFDEILSQLPISDLAAQFGVDEGEITQAAESALPALLGGLQANAADPAGADSIAAALSQHEGSIGGLNDINVDDGQKIVSHIFGDNTDQVVNQLGGLGGGVTGGLVKKLLPVLAPIVLSWLAGKVSQSGGLGSILGGVLGGGSSQPDTTQTTDGGALFPGGQGAQATPTQAPAGSTDAAQQQSSNPITDILGSVLGGGSGGSSSGGAGDILGGILGGLLGGGRR